MENNTIMVSPMFFNTYGTELNIKEMWRQGIMIDYQEKQTTEIINNHFFLAFPS